jgi:uncharacterized membrane protein
MNRSLSYRIILVAALFWCALLLLPPVLASVFPSAPAISHGLYTLFSRICHQYDERSLHLLGHKLGVCGRCAAIYFGFLLGTLLQPRFRIIGRLSDAAAWAIAAGPMALDVLLDAVGLHASTLTTRLVSGGMFGILAAFLLLPHLIEGMTQLFHATTLTKGVDHEFET